MNFESISKKYQVRQLKESDIEVIYDLCKENELYYKHCPPFVTKESIREDLFKLPPNKTLDDKFFLGFFDNEELLCVIDLIVNYPKENTAFLGFFMLEKKYQGKGIASGIFQELSTFLKSNHFNAIRLGYVKGNQQSEFFWKKNGFLPVGLEVKQPEYTVVVLEKKI